MPKPRKSGPTDRQDQFAREFVKDLDPTQAAIRAGYSPHSAKEMGSTLLGRPDVSDRIKALQPGSDERLVISVDRIEQELARIAFADTSQSQDEDGAARPAAERPKTAERLRALELLGKRHGLFTDKSEEEFEGMSEEALAERLAELLATVEARSKAV